MDGSKKYAKTRFLAPGMLGKSTKKAKVSFGFPGYSSNVGNEGLPTINVSNMTSSAAWLSQNQQGINTEPECVSSIKGSEHSPSIASVVTTKPKDGFSYQELEDLFKAGYKLSDIIGSVPLRPELGKTVNPSLKNVLPCISEEYSATRPFVRQGEASKGEEEESLQASENTTVHPIDTDIPVITKRKRIIADARPRGVNLCKRVSNLEPNKKLNVEIVNNVPIGEIGKEMVRHMGKLIRDRNIVPVRVHSWEDLEPRVMEHLWQALTDKFDSEHMDLQRDLHLNQMKRLWQNWRGLMKRDNIKPKKTIEDAMKDLPNHLTQEDWEWLVKEHYMRDDFKKLSERNSKNRGTQNMMHRTGSRPIQDVIWRDLGARDGKQPLLSEVFRRTRVRKDMTLDAKETRKYEEILEVEKDESLSRFDVIQKCFGKQDHSHVVCFGNGTKPKDVRGPLASREELTRNLRDKEKETSMLKKRLDEFEELMIGKNAAMEQNLQFLMTMALGQQSTPNL